MLPAAAVSRLTDASGAFRCDMAAMGALFATSPQARRQLAAEITAQFEAFRATGLALDHCNAHKHFHLHPFIGGLIASIGSRFGLRSVRVPLEPAGVLRKLEPDTPRIPALAMAPWALLLRQRLRAAGLLTSDRVFGLQWSGRMTRERLRGLITNLPDGLKGDLSASGNRQLRRRRTRILLSGGARSTDRARRRRKLSGPRARRLSRFRYR